MIVVCSFHKAIFIESWDSRMFSESTTGKGLRLVWSLHVASVVLIGKNFSAMDAGIFYSDCLTIVQKILAIIFLGENKL